MSLPKLLLHEPSCVFANRGGVAAYHVIWISLCLRDRVCVFLLVLWLINSDFGKDIVTP